ncbi:DNA gyrase subunit A [Pseudoroseomonas wenyumeiae]|uniref:DNA gyrase subunit A n=1 Tax=Teichococcus wenyumeiae TaxID=2478470 RepID=A0A3A9JI25_9PROT|nr:DNA gyrase subunit A [Pseudoroseomonas wenyumeiae]RKK04931.1 DNA gyrase subunit A [Pseudoroseomonas wenyumeiae]RMI26196.1 DNA gyrase subunit A [Pseudoroseomonas wenyumeiae]
MPIAIEEEMRSSYLAYAMSVIVSRALPDARDGLKPVHRRILFSMNENGFTNDKPYKKSARVVGDVMGKYHPHGDSAIYDAMVRMAQTFSLRVPLIDGQGNFGSMDGDPPAAMRYTEARLAKSATALLEGIDEDTIDFQPNYDESAEEPRVLPAAFPNLLVNGANGIAVGMATNIPPHNPNEVIDATLKLIAEPDTSLDDLMKIIPGPDFPTGALIIGRSGIRSAFETGRGSIVLRARAEVEEMRGGRSCIAISEIPYQVNKSSLIERIADLVRTKQLEGISDLRDESDRSGLRIVIELKKDATPEVVLNHLYRYTQLQTSVAVNMLALDEGRPVQMGLIHALKAFIKFREEVILRRSRFRLGKARDRGHLLIGLSIAVANIDEVIKLIRESSDAAAARAALMARDWPAGDIAPLLALVDDAGNQVVNETVRLTEAQARGILELRLHRLTGLEQEKITAELDEVAGRIRELLEILSSHPRRMELMSEELIAVRGQIASSRLSEIVDGIADQDDESLVEPGLMVVTLTRDGYVKRTPLDVFRAQNRGGRGRSAAGTRQDDVVVRSFNAHTHQWVLFFTSRGIAFREKVWKLPEAGPTARGRSLRQLLQLQEKEGVTAVLPLPQDESLWENLHLVFATAQGNVRRNRLSDFKNVRSSGLIAMKLDEGDSLIGVSTCREGDDVLLATRQGRAIRFMADVETLRVFAGRDSTGVRGIKLGQGDEVIALSVLRHVEATPDERAAYLKLAAQKRRNGSEEAEAGAEIEEETEASSDIALPAERAAEMEDAEEILLTVTDGGFGKRSSAYEYRVSGRGGQGIANITLTQRTGREVVTTFPVRSGDDVMLVTDNGRLIRMPVDQVRITGRSSMGVTLLRLNDGERVTSCFTVVEEQGVDEADSTDA